MFKDRLVSFGLLFAVFAIYPHNSYGENMSSVMKIIPTQSLDLTGNQLALLPGNLFNQVDLEELWIDDNQISEIPLENE